MSSKRDANRSPLSALVVHVNIGDGEAGARRVRRPAELLLPQIHASPVLLLMQFAPEVSHLHLRKRQYGLDYMMMIMTTHWGRSAEPRPNEKHKHEESKHKTFYKSASSTEAGSADSAFIFLRMLISFSSFSSLNSHVSLLRLLFLRRF